AGRLYSSRTSTPLLQAVANCPGVRLTLILPDPPPASELAAIAEHSGNGLRVIGALPHEQVQQLLERADILVNFGDRAQPVRTPAKLYEYFGIRRPILHVHSSGADAAVALLRGLRRAWICADDETALRGLLSDLDRKSTRLNSSHVKISYAVFCLKKKKLTHVGGEAAHGRTGQGGELQRAHRDGAAYGAERYSRVRVTQRRGRPPVYTVASGRATA